MPEPDSTATPVESPLALTAPGTSEPLSPDHGPDDDGIWRLVRPERAAIVAQFAQSYGAVRRAEGLAPIAPDAVRALPFADLTGHNVDRWAARAASYRRFVAAAGLDHTGDGAPNPARTVVDVGAGSGWLAADLSRRGWAAAAVDLCVEDGDGLRAAQAHPEPITLIQAEMEALPLAASSVDLVVFNAALHYATTIDAALIEAARITRPGGRIAVLDSPVFRDPTAGAAMVDAFAAHTESVHGLVAAPLAGPGFVTDDDLGRFAQTTGASWTRVDDSQGITAAVRAWRGRRRAGREVARLPLLLMTMPGRDGA